MKHTPSDAWWETDHYAIDEGLPEAFERRAGPNGVAMVRSYGNDKTDPGWGLVGGTDAAGKKLPGFMPRYLKNEFNARRVLYGYDRGKWSFAYVMRSLSVVCIDIDGKNGGLEGVLQLGHLPRTLAEVSKSGTGYHLFYATADTWDEKKGFGALGDRVALKQGVDVRGTGCVFHTPQQRWNGESMAMLPTHLYEALTAREERTAQQHAFLAAVVEEGDELEVLLMHDTLERELAAPIPEGRRNNTLFAIGQKMKKADVPDWETKIEKRAAAIGLDYWETEKLIENIRRYE